MFILAASRSLTPTKVLLEKFKKKKIPQGKRRMGEEIAAVREVKNLEIRQWMDGQWYLTHQTTGKLKPKPATLWGQMAEANR